MTSSARNLPVLCFLVLTILPGSAGRGACAAEVYAAPRLVELKKDVTAWLQSRQLENSPVADAIKPLWELEESASAADLFDALLQTFYYADDDARKLIDSCRNLKYSPEVLSLALGENRIDEPFFLQNLKLFYGRHLATLTLYDEALAILSTVDPAQVVDPASLLFHRAVCEHHLLLKKEGVETLKKLLEETQAVPDRYRRLGELMQDDLGKVEEKSLGEVARQMKDVERRLSLGRPGEKTQEVERKIIETLDELIKKAEEQQSSSASGGAAKAGPANKPADESYLGGVKGEGLTDKKDLGHKDHWGDLPPKAQAAAKNLLDRQFPPHYRQAVEEYLKKLADRPAP